MFLHLTQATKRRFILELREFWANHPAYPDLPDNIQGKYSFKERPQYGIIVKGGQANKLQLSADNFMGTLKSYCFLAYVPNYTGLSCEWVREDAIAIQDNRGVFPSLPGAYYCEITGEKEFHVDPLYTVQAEQVMMTSPVEGTLLHTPLRRSLRLYELPSSRKLVEGVDYTLNEDGSVFTLREPLPRGLSLTADYRYPGESSGPWPLEYNTGVNKPIPGCVLAFGHRVAVGDRFAVIVTPYRQDAYLQYGGKWEQTLDITVMTRDTNAQMEIADQTAVYLWGILRPTLSSQGVEVTDVSMGGESEEVYDENGDDYFYNSSISVTVETEWGAFVPLTVSIEGFTGTTTMVAESLGLRPYRDMYFQHPLKNYEVIK